jgi:glycosyltransferase involved in cell wall biosynthesis
MLRSASKRLCYVVSHSSPHAADGYATRTHAVASACTVAGMNVIAANRPGRPWDLPGFEDDSGSPFPARHRQDGITYLFTRKPSSVNLHRDAWVTQATAALVEVFKVFKPGVVMAASNWLNAWPAMQAAQALGLPFFYEVRGFWELSRLAHEPGYADTPAFQEEVERETAVAQAARRVFTLTRFMRDELVRRGVSADKIDLVPNGYTGALPEQPTLGRRVRGAGEDAAFTVGYIGSFSAYEGLDDLLWACAQLHHQGLPTRLRLVGGAQASGVVGAAQACPVSARLQALAAQWGFAQGLHITGRVSPQALAQHYAALDLFVIPRLPLPVCELVSPIKPLEAAAHGVPLLVSNVAPLEEMAQEAGFALFNKGSREDLLRALQALALNPAQCVRMAHQARRWVETERRFEKLVQPMLDAFNACEPAGVGAWGFKGGKRGAAERAG